MTREVLSKIVDGTLVRYIRSDLVVRKKELKEATDISCILEKLLANCVGVTRYFEIKRMHTLAELKASRRESDINDWMDGDRKPRD